MHYNLELDELNDEDIRLVCEIYWMDFVCIPFEVPKPCNITHLLLKYYNKYVSYDDCCQLKHELELENVSRSDLGTLNSVPRDEVS